MLWNCKFTEKYREKRIRGMMIRWNMQQMLLLSDPKKERINILQKYEFWLWLKYTHTHTDARQFKQFSCIFTCNTAKCEFKCAFEMHIRTKKETIAQPHSTQTLLSCCLYFGVHLSHVWWWFFLISLLIAIIKQKKKKV